MSTRHGRLRMAASAQARASAGLHKSIGLGTSSLLGMPPHSTRFTQLSHSRHAHFLSASHPPITVASRPTRCSSQRNCWRVTMTTNVMTLLLDGALRAAQLAPLAFTLAALQPAAAQLPRPVMTAAAPAAVVPAVVHGVPPAAPTAVPTVLPAVIPVVLESRTGLDALQLTIAHVDVQVSGGQALVRTTLIYRNDGTVPVDAQYSVPLPALFGAPGQPLEALGQGEDIGGCGDEPYDVAQFAEAGEPLDVGHERGSVIVAPGEEVTLVMARPVDLISRGERHRLVLPLDFARGGSFTPRFSAEVQVTATQPVQSLASATHGGEVMGVGSTSARLVIPEGRVYEARFLAFDFELGSAAYGMQRVADTPVRNAALWGGEGRGLDRTAFMAGR
jgi:hypothetical protein